ncbi:MAG: hypothetical protein ABJB47_02650 [Actinomycetota bacterium]
MPAAGNAEVLRLELDLQTPECRDRARITALLAANFTEVGASGRVWDLASTLELLGAESAGDGWRLVHHQGTLLPGQAADISRAVTAARQAFDNGP